jgi:hypothetical protein
MSSPTRYQSVISDSARWEGFRLRAGDIIISTPPKCGTTWLQMICALLIFQTPDLPKPVDQLSPWLDQLLRPIDSVVTDLEAQEHRRFIKTHTPLDGLPFDPEVTYITVARDPRDVALSMDNHLANMNWEVVMALREAAHGLHDLAEVMPNGIPEPLATERERFWAWIGDATPISQVLGLSSHLHHLSTFFEARERPNVILLHYGDLKADLEGQMRGLASRLGIRIPEERWPELVHAATFSEMKRRARETGPNQTECVWLDRERFFHRARQGEWRELMGPGDLERYAARVRQLTEPGFAAWVHGGPI